MNSSQMISKFVSRLDNLAQELGLVSDVYVEDKNGEYSLVDSEIIANIENIIKNMREDLRTLENEITDESKETVSRLSKYLEQFINNTRKNSVDVKNIVTILKGTREAIKNETKKINIGELRHKKRGGDIATVSTQEEAQIKSKKNIGGVIVAKKGEIRKYISGEYTKVDEVLKKITIAIEQISKMSNTPKTPSKHAIKNEVSSIVRANLDRLKRRCLDCSQNLPDSIGVKNVKKQKSYAGLYKVAAVGLSLALLFSGIGKKSDFRIAIQDDMVPYQIELMDDIINENNNVLDTIEGVYHAMDSAGKEAEVIGDYSTINLTDGPEVEARKEKLKSTEDLKSYMGIITNNIRAYNEIKNPTNVQWINCQKALNEMYIILMEYNNELGEDNIYYLKLWNDFNSQHIAMGDMTQNGNNAHLDEIVLNNDQVMVYEENGIVRAGKIAETESKIAFYNKLMELPNIEGVKNIEDISESLYRFMQTDIAKSIGEEKLFEFLKTADLNLFGAYTKLNIENAQEFLPGYKLMENTYGEYITQYCEGDNKRVNEIEYVQYFIKALDFTDKIGETGFFTTFQAMLEQNDINRNFYNEYGRFYGTYERDEARNGFWNEITAYCKTLLNRERRGKYKETIYTIGDLLESGENNIETGERL